MLGNPVCKACTVSELAELAREAMTAAGSSLSDEQVMEICDRTVSRRMIPSMVPIREMARLSRLVFCSMRCELEVLQDLADDPFVTEIMVNGPYDVFVERASRTARSDITFESAERLEQVIQRIAARVGREFNDLNPIVDARLSDGSRINAVHSNIALGGPVLTVRKFAAARLTMDQLIINGDISEDGAAFLRLMVENGYNMFISGGTSSGKTTFLNILADYIPPDERVIVIEDSAELQIAGHENLVRLEAKSANGQGRGAVPMRDLIKASLRMRPDRIIVGEVRGGEVVDMLSAMSTGHDGSLSTGHANSSAGMVGRLETMALSGSDLPSPVIKAQIAEAIDIFIHLERTGDGHRRVLEISELIGFSDGAPVLETIFGYEPDKGLRYTGRCLQNMGKLALRGGDEAIARLQEICPRKE